MTTVLDKSNISKIIKRLSYEIIEKNSGNIEELCLIGICSRGDIISDRIKNVIEKDTKKELKSGTLDITFYRDDLDLLTEFPEVKKTNIDFDITNKHIVLVDDVLYTGRTIRAALNAIFDYGRPSKISLAILIDRKERQLPISADYIGYNADIRDNEIIIVNLKERDGNDSVILKEKGNDR